MSDNQADRTIFGIVRNSNGSYTRLTHFPCTPATPDHDTTTPVLSKDIPINPNNKTWLRVFLPKEALDHSPSTTKLPLIVYFHGGGFVFTNANSTMMHDFCAGLARDATAVVVSVEYRLAPENHLPAAYNDAIEALECIKTTKDRWLTQFADFSNCFLMGTSAGANIVYHTSLRVVATVDDLNPIKIQGLILHQPFFGGLERTESDMRMANAEILTLQDSDLMWDLSLPIGADRDHEYCNPVMGHGLEKLGRVRELGWRLLVTSLSGDHLIDRQVEFTKILEERGLQVVTNFGEGYHGMEIMEAPKAKELFRIVKEFIDELSVTDEH